MPLYEYVCEKTGETIEVLRPMAEADKPLPDPAGKGRTFVRKQSTFAAQGAGAGSRGQSLPMAGGGGGCACGKGGCGSH